MKLFPAMVLMMLAGAPLCRASLDWKTTDLELRTKVGQEQAVAVYRFRNAGDRPVRIISLDPSCRCMAAAPGKPVVAPGEWGEIRVDVSLTGYTGRLRRSVAVETDDPGHRYTNLTLTVDVPEPVAITPRFLYWTVGEAPKGKSLAIAVADPENTSVQGVKSEDPAFHAVLRAEGKGRYRLTIRPDATRRPRDTPVQVKAVIGGRTQVYIVYAAVKQP